MNNPERKIDEFNSCLHHGGRLSVFIFRTSAGNEIERLGCVSPESVVEQCFFLYIKKLIDEFDPTQDYVHIGPDYVVERHDLPDQQLPLYTGDEVTYFRENIYPQLEHEGHQPADTIYLREAQFNLMLNPKIRNMAQLREHYIHLNKYLAKDKTIGPDEIELMTRRYARSSDRFLLPGFRMQRLWQDSSLPSKKMRQHTLKR